MNTKTNYSVVIKRNVMIPMRDGVHLAADIYHPANNGQLLDGKLPTLLERTPYGKRGSDFVKRASGFAQNGYIVVLQDCRGCDDSEGEFYFLVDDPLDGQDTVEWITQQPWSDGQVSTYGTSYMCWTQGSTATQNAKLSCMFPNMGGWSAYGVIHPGGTYDPRFTAWAFWQATFNTNKNLKKNPVVDKVMNLTDFRDWLKRLPLKKGHSPLTLMPNYEKWVLDQTINADYNDYWKQPGFAWDEHVDKITDTPTYVCGGWYDAYIPGTFDTFNTLRKAKKSHVKLLVGPWIHGTYTTEWSYAGDADFGAAAGLESFDEIHLRWFERWMRGIENGIDQEPPVRLFIMGGGSGQKNHDGRFDHGGHWRNEQEWPLARTKYTNYYLHADGSLNPKLPAEGSAKTTYLSDPNNPVPTIGGNIIGSLSYVKPPPVEIDVSIVPRVMRREMITPMGGFDQRESPEFFGCKPPYIPLSSRPDVIVFQTELLEKDTEVTGPIEINLWVSSSALDTDFTGKLIDVCPPNDDYPGGYALSLAYGVLRARYRNSFKKAELLNPGEVYELTIHLDPTGNLFKKGHRIRLDIASSNFPRYDINPNTGEPIGLNKRTIVAENTIYHDKEHPSHVILPIIPL